MTHPSDDADRKSPLIAAAIILLLVALLLGADIATDLQAGSGGAHVAVESSIVLVAAATGVWLWTLLRDSRRKERVLNRDLASARAEAAQWKERAGTALRGLGQEIDDQFGRWSLTPAEREVGLLILKGLSYKEIAEARGTSERTIRQQAQSAFHKAELSGRAEFSAFFLEDLLLPQAAAGGASGAPDSRDASPSRVAGPGPQA